MKKAGLYIHIPFCKTKCIYCDFYSITERENQIPEFTNAILKEIDLYKHYKNKWKFNTLFLGGGTPSLLPASSTAFTRPPVTAGSNAQENILDLA